VNRVAIVDSRVGNIDSVVRAVQECRGTPLVVEDPLELRDVDRIILPGVGAFPDGIASLRSRGLDAALRERVIGDKLPFLGICLGMQLLASRGFEVTERPGLGWIPGDVRRLRPTDGDRVPHVGWNELHLERSDCPLFAGVPQGKDFYFVHSYHFECDPADVVARTPYCGGFVSAVQRENVFGVQFHLEKSQRPGFAVLRNFLAL
jgi:glutamine amidotransferase